MKKIKIQPKHRKRTYDEIWIPEIKMEGKWLRELGFEIGDQIEIKQQKNKLTITLIDKKEKK
jgi:toxic protein SymE